MKICKKPSVVSRYNLQERRKGCRDVCDEPLFQDIEEELFEVPTVAKLLALHDNYEPCVSEEEDVTREEIQEEWDFLDAVIDTKVMEIAREFMVGKGLLPDDITVFKRFLHRMWFSLYPRAKRNAGSGPSTAKTMSRMVISAGGFVRR